MRHLISAVVVSVVIAGCARPVEPELASPGRADSSVMDVAHQPPPAHQPPLVAVQPAPQPLQPVVYEPPPQPAPEPVVTQTPPAAASRTHTVRQGDTLYSLARQYYGDGGQWQRIVDANPGVSPQALRIGQALVIP